MSNNLNLYQSVLICDAVVINFVLCLAEHGVFGADFMLVDVNIALIRNVEHFVLVWQDYDVIWVVFLNVGAFIVILHWYAVLDLGLKSVMSHLFLSLLTSLVIYLYRQVLLLTDLTSKFSRTLRNAILSDFVQHLQFVEKLALVGYERLLFVQLLSQVGKLLPLFILFVFYCSF